MEKITEKWLKRFGACLEGIEWVKEQKTSDPINTEKNRNAASASDAVDAAAYAVAARMCKGYIEL